MVFILIIHNSLILSILKTCPNFHYLNFLIVRVQNAHDTLKSPKKCLYSVSHISKHYHNYFQ